MGNCQNVLASGQRHHCTGWILVRGCGVDQAGRCLFVDRVRCQTEFVHGNRMGGKPRRHEGLDGSPVGGVFHPHRVFVIGQQLCAEFQRLLCATGDDDLFYVQSNAAKDPQIVSHGTAQRCVATAVAVVQHFRIGHAPVLVLQALPERDRKRTEIGQAWCEWLNLQLRCTKGARQCGAPVGEVWQMGVSQTGTMARSGLGQVVVDVRATADAAYQITFDSELVECGHHRVA